MLPLSAYISAILLVYIAPPFPPALLPVNIISPSTARIFELSQRFIAPPDVAEILSLKVTLEKFVSR